MRPARFRALLAGVAVAAAVGAQEVGTESSHDRMVRELHAIASSRAVWNPFVQGDRLAELRARADALTPSTPVAERFAVVADLAIAELKLGSVERAIEALEATLELMASAAPSERGLVEFQLGLAHLRLAERSNCREGPGRRSCILPISGDGVHHHTENTRQAIEWFESALAHLPERSAESLATRWLLNIAYQSTGLAPEEVPETVRLPPSLYRSDQEFPELKNRAPEAGLDAFDLAGGAIVEDFDGDGRLDVLTSTWSPDGALKLRLNRGDGRFVDRTVEAGLEGITGGLNLVHADFDGDGDFDVLVLRGAWLRDEGTIPNSLLRNDGAGRFEDVTFDVGLGDDRSPTQTAAWADYDLDGHLDLYVGNEGSRGRFPSRLFRNRGDGTFLDVAREAGVENHRFAKGVAWGDYDGDGDPDLYVSNWLDPNRLYRNDGDGTFTDVAEELGMTEPLASFPVWFWDFDNDGQLDIYVSNFPYRPGEGARNLGSVVASYLGASGVAEGPRLYRGDGAGGFRDVAAASGLGRINMPMGAAFGDLDGDGFLDFYLGTGYPEYEGLVPNLLYRNDGGRRFRDVTMAAGVSHLQKGHAVVFADLDDDGDVDLFEQMGGFFPDDAYHNVLYENPGFGHHWVRVALEGTRSNRAGVGARLRLRTIAAETTREIYRHVGFGGSFGSAPLTQQIGLGAAGRIDRLEVRWPTGAAQAFVDAPVDRTVRIFEGTATR